MADPSLVLDAPQKRASIEQAYADIARWDVGGGIVADSTPDAEWSEALAKAAPLAALGVAVERLRG